jgi:biopolymer transport protein ExbB/TolQ
LIQSLLSRAEIVELAERSMHRSSSEVHLEMKRGLSGLATIASTAPLVGMFGTVTGIFDAFKGCGGSHWACLAATIEGICEALVTTALGLLVAVPTLWCYNYLSHKMEAFDIEMEVASLELLNYFDVRLGRQ